MNFSQKSMGSLRWVMLVLLLLPISACQSESQAPDQEIRIVPYLNRGPADPNVPAPVEEDSGLQAQESATEALPAPPAEPFRDSSPEGEEIAEASVSPSPSASAGSFVAEPRRWNYKKYFFVLFDGM